MNNKSQDIMFIILIIILLLTSFSILRDLSHTQPAVISIIKDLQYIDGLNQ
jgi:hypothetical protein